MKISYKIKKDIDLILYLLRILHAYNSVGDSCAF